MTLTPSTLDAARRLTDAISRQVERSPRFGLPALAVLVGFVGGLGAVGFTELIRFIDWFFFSVIEADWLGSLGGWRLLLIPALGAALVGPITQLFAPEARGHGVPEVMLAMETGGGRIRPRVAIAKSFASALSIGSGGSVGKEGPIVQIGSAFGSTLGQVLRLSEENLKLLVASGAAAGIAATFNAPIAGVFFALEIILRRFNTRNFSVIVLASVIATVAAVAFLGDHPAFRIPSYRLEHAVEIPLYVLLGIVCGSLAVLFTHGLYWTEDRFESLPFPPMVFVPIVGGVIVGTIGLIDRGALGLGQETLEQALNEGFATKALTTLLFLKMAATVVTIGSGGSGGVFRPSLFMGAMAGGVFGAAVHGIAPGLTAGPGAYAAVGMAAMFAGAARAPITAILILFEMTRDYGIILPLMTAVVTSTVVSQILSRGTIYTIKLQRRGIEISEEFQAQPVSIMQSIPVADAMSPVAVMVEEDTAAEEVIRALSDDLESAAVVVNDISELVGIITQLDLTEAISSGDAVLTAGEICSRDVRTVFADQTLHDALGVLGSHQFHALPVVERSTPRNVCGILRRVDITGAYSDALEQQVSAARSQRFAAITGDNVRYLELRVARASSVNGRLLNEVQLTDDAIVVAVRHDGATVIPRGHTRLSEGDRITVLAAAAVADEVRAIFEGQDAQPAR